MGAESASASTSTPSPSGKRTRDPEDEVYVDNLRSHKRYLSEIMAYSLNGLTVGDTLSESMLDSPARSTDYRDDTSIQYSPMSEDSDDSRFCEYPTTSVCSSQPESRPTSPVSPYRCQKPLSTLSSNNCLHSSHTPAATIVSCSQPRQRGPETERRFPSSPSDICHSGDLRRTALLRSVQMRAQPSAPNFEAPFCSPPNMEVDTCFIKRPSDEDREYDRGEDSSSNDHSDPESSARSKPPKMLNLNMKGDESFD